MRPVRGAGVNPGLQGWLCGEELFGPHLVLEDPLLPFGVLPPEHGSDADEEGHAPDDQDHDADPSRGPLVDVVNVRDRPVPEMEAVDKAKRVLEVIMEWAPGSRRVFSAVISSKRRRLTWESSWHRENRRKLILSRMNK